jgi:Fe-S cluster biogenesis protein NfuA
METAVSNQELFDRVEKALDSIRPYLKSDGGDVKLLEVTADNDVKLELLGNCSSCAMSAMTLRAGVEEAIRKMAPEVKGVVAINN